MAKRNVPKTDIPNLFDFKDGHVAYWDIELDETATCGIANNDLKEDLAQIIYPNNLALDIGWLGEYAEPNNGCFFVQLIKNADWEKPLAKIPAIHIETVAQVSNHLVSLIDVIINESTTRYINTFYTGPDEE